MKNSFNQRKKDILLKSDKSSIGGWDEKIVELCEKINKLDNYYTTSSCAGRAVVMEDVEKKGPGLFLYVSHDKIILEVKGMSGIADEHIAQTLNYLKVSGNKLGLLVNFGKLQLQYKRILL